LLQPATPIEPRLFSFSHRRPNRAAELYKHHVGVARILEMPSGVSSQAASSIAAAKAKASRMRCASDCQRCAPKKMADITTPAMVIEAMAPELNGQK
jgi:hypothetical protein